jgi:hypothetical protein
VLALFAAVFEHHDGKSYDQYCPRMAKRTWTATGGVLCPIVTGAALADTAGAVAAGLVIETGPVLCPLILAPFVATAAHRTGCGLELEWPGIRFTFDRGEVRLDGSSVSLHSFRVQRSVCRRARGDPRGHFLAGAASAAEVDPAVWLRLDRFAVRTYVPASEVSRLKGAGAGMIDND